MRTAHEKKVCGSSPVMGIIRTTLIASTTQHSISSGGLDIAGCGDSFCKLFRKRDFEEALLVPCSLQIAQGLLVMGHSIIDLRLSCFLSYSVNMAAKDFPLSSTTDTFGILRFSLWKDITSCRLMGSVYFDHPFSGIELVSCVMKSDFSLAGDSVFVLVAV